jgi:hypothetical protein
MASRSVWYTFSVTMYNSVLKIVAHFQNTVIKSNETCEKNQRNFALENKFILNNLVSYFKIIAQNMLKAIWMMTCYRTKNLN